MADNGRWFKVWTAILADPGFQSLSVEDRGRWVTLGALTKLSGSRGVLVVDGIAGAAYLARTLDVDGDVAATVAAINRLPNVVAKWDDDAPRQGHFGTGNRVYGKLTVTWRNWRKYQEDSTQAERQKASRAKRRGEERRKRNTSDTTVKDDVPMDTPPQSENPDGLSALWEGKTKDERKPEMPASPNARAEQIRNVIRSTAARVAVRHGGNA